MVKRYDSPRRRAKTLKEMPFYIRYMNELRILGFVVPFVFVFGPPVFRFFAPSPVARLEQVNPRIDEDIHQMRQKYRKRQEALAVFDIFPSNSSDN